MNTKLIELAEQAEAAAVARAKEELVVMFTIRCKRHLSITVKPEDVRFTHDRRADRMYPYANLGGHTFSLHPTRHSRRRVLWRLGMLSPEVAELHIKLGSYHYRMSSLTEFRELVRNYDARGWFTRLFNRPIR